MIPQLRYKVFSKIGRLSLIDPHLDYIYSINLKEATA